MECGVLSLQCSLSFLLSLPHTALLNHVSGVHVTPTSDVITRANISQGVSAPPSWRGSVASSSVFHVSLSTVSLFLFYPGHPSIRQNLEIFLEDVPTNHTGLASVCLQLPFQFRPLFLNLGHSIACTLDSWWHITKPPGAPLPFNSPFAEPLTITFSKRNLTFLPLAHPSHSSLPL